MNVDAATMITATAGDPRITKGALHMARILWIVLVVLVVLWLIGFIAKLGGAFIHILLVIALIVLVVNLVTGRKGV